MIFCKIFGHKWKTSDFLGKPEIGKRICSVCKKEEWLMLNTNTNEIKWKTMYEPRKNIDL